jgi:hypothetical protein
MKGMFAQVQGLPFKQLSSKAACDFNGSYALREHRHYFIGALSDTER